MDHDPVDQESSKTSSSSLPPQPAHLWHTLEVDEVLETLHVTLEAGLDETEVASRQLRFGPNELHRDLPEPPAGATARQLLSQFVRPLSLFLIGAALAAGWLGKGLEASLLLAIVLANAVLGFLQGFRAERALASLMKTADPVARVRRSYRLQEVPSWALVPGDILLLEEGSTVPADARLLVTANLRLQEAVMTGETQSVEKIPQGIPLEQQVSKERVPGERPLGERRNMVYMGSLVTSGRGQAVVVATGIETELGKLANRVHNPAQGDRSLGWIVSLERFTAWSGLGMVMVLLAAGAWRDLPTRAGLEAGLALAAGAVPLTLPALVTLVLALGARKMRRRNALVRKLPTVETLGAVSVICSDRTGTLTENHMTITVMDITGEQTRMTAALRHGKPLVQSTGKPEEPPGLSLPLILAGAALCNNGSLERISPDSDEYHAIGDPSEGTQLAAAAHYGLWKTRLERLFPRLLEVPYANNRRRMSTVHRSRLTPHISPDERSIAALFEGSYPYLVLVKGNPTQLLEVTSHVWEDGQIEPLTAERRAAIRKANIQLAREGQRVTAVAYRPLASLVPLGDEARSRLEALPPELRESIPHSPKDVPRSEALAGMLERDLIYLGLVGLLDPPRAEVLPAITMCQNAGIRPVMFTSDHPSTALEIARSLHITNGTPARAMTGKDLARLTPLQLESSVDEVTVFARITPAHKLAIVQALQRRGHVVATTGEGVNDAPALRRSDIGVAKGLSGTSVSKEAGNLVILDDNFATIVRAVEEGRRANEAVRTLVRMALGGALARVLVIFIAALAGFFAGLPETFPLLMVLWFGLVVEGILGTGLVSRTADFDAMRGPPVDRQAPFFTRHGLGWQIVLAGISMAVAAVLAVVLEQAGSDPVRPPGTALQLAFATLMFGQVWHTLLIGLERSAPGGLFRPEYWMFWAALWLGMAASLAVLIASPLQPARLETPPLNSQGLLICLAASLLVPGIMVLAKFTSHLFPPHRA